MDTDLFALRSFVRLADELNFARTAAALHISAPKLTRVIQTLELQVGTQLVARSTHGASLTAAGVEFLSSASRMVAEADWVGRRFGKRRIAASATFVVGCLALACGGVKMMETVKPDYKTLWDRCWIVLLVVIAINLIWYIEGFPWYIHNQE